MREEYEHPDITSAERTGYPAGHKENPCCADCGAEMESYGDQLYQDQGEWLCGDCFKERLMDISPWELASMIGTEVLEYGE